MKKNNKGFFLVESIVVIALVTIVMAYVYPNLAKLYDNFQNRAVYYDQTEDLYELRAYYNQNQTSIDCSDASMHEITINSYTNKTLSRLYISKYIANNTFPGDYEFNKYLKRVKINSYDQEACRLIGIFNKTGTKKNGSTYTYRTFASIKIY